MRFGIQSTWKNNRKSCLITFFEIWFSICYKFIEVTILNIRFEINWG